MTQRSNTFGGWRPVARRRPVCWDPNGPLIALLKQGYQRTNIHPEFPSHRRMDAGPSTESGVHDQFADSSLLGHALNELSPLSEAPGLDFAVWMENVARFGIAVKRGTYPVREASYEEEHTPCPVPQTRAKVRKVLGFKTFIIPVLLFATRRWTCSRGIGPQSAVKVLFEFQALMDLLLALAHQTRLTTP